MRAAAEKAKSRLILTNSSCTRKGAVIVLVFLLAFLAEGAAQSFCHLAKPVGTAYTDTITKPGTYYYSAWTYDLPMDVYFITDEVTCAPEVWTDLTCTPGQYNDPNIRELIRDTVKYGISVPMRLNCEPLWVDSISAYVYHIKLGKSYRNRLKLVGVDYNVQAYVKVVLPCGGVAHMEQDTSSQACFNDARRMALTDSTHVLANDSLSTYIFPYKDWLGEADSVALYWEGNAPARIWVAGDNCEFQTDVQHVWDYYDVAANGEVHLSKSMLSNAVNSGTQDTAGYLFAKIVSVEEGRLFSRPLVPELQGATLLQIGKTVHVDVAEEAFYCFPHEWESVEWVANTRKLVTMYLHASPEEEPVDSFKFDLQDSVRRVLTWSKPEMKLLRAHATGPLFFVRLDCSRNEFSFTPRSLENSGACVPKAIRLRSGVPQNAGKDLIFALYYPDWEGYPMEISWTNSDAGILQNFFIADTCEFTLRYSTNATKKRCVYYKQTARGSDVLKIDSATIAGWKERVTPEGFFYVRMTTGGTIIFTTAKPAETDPEGDDPEIPTAVENVQGDNVQSTKVIENGQLYLMYKGTMYNVQGMKVVSEK